jgi:hypothetical protein
MLLPRALAIAIDPTAPSVFQPIRSVLRVSLRGSASDSASAVSGPSRLRLCITVCTVGQHACHSEHSTALHVVLVLNNNKYDDKRQTTASSMWNAQCCSECDDLLNTCIHILVVPRCWCCIAYLMSSSVSVAFRSKCLPMRAPTYNQSIEEAL